MNNKSLSPAQVPFAEDPYEQFHEGARARIQEDAHQHAHEVAQAHVEAEPREGAPALR